MQEADVVANINPLLKIVFIQKVLRFVRPSGIFVIHPSRNEVIELKHLPRFLQLREVNTNWSETIDYYTSIPSNVISNFCRYLEGFVGKKHWNFQHRVTVARDAFVWNSRFIRTWI